MYPNLYYVFKDWFGWDINALKVFYTFGVFVAVAFIAAAWVLTQEFKRKEKEGLLRPRSETIIRGKPATTSQLLLNALIGFIFGYKLIGVLLASREAGLDLQEYIFSPKGSFAGGLIVAAVMAYLKFREKNKQKLPKPEKETIKVWPHDRVGDIVILALVFGIIGAKVFDNLENWERFIEDPIGNLFAPSGLTFYGGLIFAASAIIYYASKRGIKIVHLLDSAAPALMIAYAIGRIGCQVAGDGDWGIYNSAYISNEPGKVTLAVGDDFTNKLKENESYFLHGTVTDSTGTTRMVTDRISQSLDEVPHKSFRGSSFLPAWMFAFTYPHNVNEDGIQIPGCEGHYCRALPQPVFPTPFYEVVTCFLLFLVLWMLRRKIVIPGALFSLYLVFNGIERFLVETIRVNTKYPVSIFGYNPTQAELISAMLVITGIVGLIFVKRKFASDK